MKRYEMREFKDFLEKNKVVSLVLPKARRDVVMLSCCHVVLDNHENNPPGSLGSNGRMDN